MSRSYERRRPAARGGGPERVAPSVTPGLDQRELCPCCKRKYARISCLRTTEGEEERGAAQEAPESHGSTRGLATGIRETEWAPQSLRTRARLKMA